MKHNHRLLNLLLIASIFAPGAAGAEPEDKIAYVERQYIGNVSYGSDNPVSESYMPFTDIADMHIGFLRNSGDFHSADAAESFQSWLVSFTGMKKVGKVVFAGGLTYDNTIQENRRWNNTLYLSPCNPYIIGDSVKSKFNRETFNLNGAAVFSASERWRLALRARYDVGSSATQKDPRPEIKGMRFTLNPGVEYCIGNNNLGLSAHVGWLSETSATTVEKTTTKQYVFLFQGLGIYEIKDAMGYRRRYNGMDYGVSLQFAVNRDSASRISDFIELAYSHEYENATDGSSAVRYKGGRYMGSEFSLQNRLRLRSGENVYHNITLRGMMHNSVGRWYTQKASVDASGALIYEVINEAEYYEGKRVSLSAGYRYDLMSGKTPNVSASFNAIFDRQELKNKLYGASQICSMLDMEASVAKRFRVRKSCIGVSLTGLYGFSPEHNLNVSAIPAVYAKVIQGYTIPNYDFLSSGYFGGGISATFSLPLNIYDYNTLLNITTSAEYRKASASKPSVCHTADRYGIYASVGFVF